MFHKLFRLNEANSVELDLDFLGRRERFGIIDINAWVALDEGYQFGFMFGLLGLTFQTQVSLFMSHLTPVATQKRMDGDN